MTDCWPGRLFGPGLAPSGEPATVRVVGEVLVIRRDRPGDAGDDEYQVAAGGVRLRRVGHDQRGLELAWEHADPQTASAAAGRGTAWACHVIDGSHAEALVAALPPSARADVRELATHDERQRLKHRIGLTALAFLIALPVLLLLLAVFALDGIASFVTQRIPVEQEQAIARRYAAAYEQDPSMRQDGPRWAAARAIVDRLVAPGASYDYDLFVADDAAINAFALPGGVVVVNDGLIEATRTPAELAGVLAHEIQHVELRHGLQALVKQAGVAMIAIVVTGDIGGNLASDLGGRLLGLKFSRDAESEADATGLDRLVAAQVDPAGMATFFELLAEKSDGGVALLSTHPASDRRAEALRARIEMVRATHDFDPLEPTVARAVGGADWPPPRRP